MEPKEIVERIMTQHWDLKACECWICEAGRLLSYAARVKYLQRNSKVKVGSVIVEPNPES